MAEWKTSITSVKKNELLVKGYPIESLMGKMTFSETIFLILKGELPSEKEGKLFDAVLSASIDHGVTPPSALATLNSASTGAPLNAAVASGILAINNFHGGAIENCMRTVMELFEFMNGDMTNKDKAREFVKEKLQKKFRFPGFGHRVHTQDPRSVRLRELLIETFDDIPCFLSLADMIVDSIEELKGIKLPVNVDGMIGIVLLTMDFPPEIANGIFMTSRVPGLIAHYFEEKTTQKPMRNIDQKEASYDGPEKRDVLR